MIWQLIRSSAATAVLFSSAAQSKKTETVAAAIARPACTRCLRGHREEKRSSVARVSTVGVRGSERADFFINEYQVPGTYVVSSKKYTWLQYKKRQIKAPATTFFNFQRRGPPRRRARKLLSLCRTHESAPTSPYMPCQTMAQRKVRGYS